MNKTAIVLGATGLVGSHITDLLLKDERYSTVRIFHRRSTGINHKKVEEHIVDFDSVSTWKELLTGDELYSAMGTTIKKAGSQDAQYKIDVTYPLRVAAAAAENGVKNYALVSSAGANKESRIFYSRIKGELEEAVKSLPFNLITILRPSVLDGDRNENRPGEAFAILAMSILGKLPGLSTYRPIHARTVANGMINSLNDRSGGCHIFESDEIFYL